MKVGNEKGPRGENEAVDCNLEIVQPRVFISYSWTSQEHQERVKSWVDRLLADGVEVVFDLYDLREGSDKYAYMEQMAGNSSVTHVLVFSDREYARKANDRSEGVGAESQIISENVYNKVEQSKFIPIICERDEKGEAVLPVFMKSLIWIDFSTDQAVNKSWEQLIRLVYGKPRHVRPRLGTRPKYLDSDVDTATGVIGARFASLKIAMLEKRGDTALQRADFLDTCIAYADELRVRQPPDEEHYGTKVLEDCRKLTAVRDGIADWLSLEAVDTKNEELSLILIEVLERLLVLKSRPPEVTHWNDNWFGAQSLFVYETFLYVIAALLRTGKTSVLHDVFRTHYIMPETEWYDDNHYVRFDAFQGDTSSLNDALSPERDKRYLSPAAELIYRQATRNDIGFDAIMESELLVFLATLIDGKLWWYPGTVHYAAHGRVPRFFLRAARHSDFVKLGGIFGIDDGGEIRRVVGENRQQFAERLSSSMAFRFPYNLFSMMNIERLDTLP